MDAEKTTQNLTEKVVELATGTNEVLNGKHPWAFVLVVISLCFFFLIVIVLVGGAYVAFESVRQQDKILTSLTEISTKMEKMNKYLYWIDRGVTEDKKSKNTFLDTQK